jgi:hypothetical protein
VNYSIFLWGLAAGAPAVYNEYLYRTLPGPWSSYLWIWIPSQLVIGYAIYRMVTTPNMTLLDAFIVWALATTVLRIIATYALGDTVRSATWVALVLVLLANVVKTFGART